jgi:Leucine-rich repeat (LRR) protein
LQQQHKNMVDDDEAPPVPVKAETVDAADARAEDKNEHKQPKQPGVTKNEEEEGTQPVVANPPVSPFKIKDLEAGRSVDYGPTFKDQVHHAGGGLLLNGVSISDVSESAVHASGNNKHRIHHQEDEFQPGDGAPSLWQQGNEPEEPTGIPLVGADRVAVLIPETQIRNEQQIDNLQHRLAQAENELRAKQKKQKRRICCIVASVLVTLLGLLLGIFLGILPKSTRDNKAVGPPTAAPSVPVPPYAAARAEVIANLINNESLLLQVIPYPPSSSSTAAAATPPQPDEQALEWLIRDDLMRLIIDDIANDDEDPLTLDEGYKAKLVQRFVLATVVYHLDTAGLLQAAALGDQAWLGASDECSWVRITCTDGAHVDRISLEGVSLQGSLPINIGLLSSSLIVLNLAENAIGGTLPSTFTLLTSLQILSLGQNKLTGFIPTDLNKLSNLVTLDISNNAMRGTDMFTPLLSMTNLESFSASTNVFLIGTIPSSIGALTNLAHFSISFTSIDGVIPSAMTLLTKLITLDMMNTQLYGSLPNELSKLTNLEALLLATNRFSGTVPSLANCTRLWFLALNDNEFQGRLPTLPASVNLTRFDDNSFTGPLPTNFPQLTNMKTFTATMNQLTGTLPELAAATNLVFLYLSSNNLTGTIPELSTLTALEELLLGFNRFNGTIPDLASSSALTTLFVQSNALTGTIPSTLGPSLGYVIFDTNILTGTLPSFSNYPKLTQLAVNSNKLTGTLPSSYASLTSLVTFGFSINRLTGTIPSEYSALTAVKDFNVAENMLEGRLPSALSDMTSLTWLNVRSNQLTGSLPSEWGALTKLTKFSARNNAFTGTIPTAFVQWSAIESAFFQNTLLVGSVPFCSSNSSRLTNATFGADCGEVNCPCCAVCCPETTANVSVNSTCLPAVRL